MIHVLASIVIEEGKMPDVLKIYENFVPLVTGETGCLMYQPTLDVDTPIPTQVKDDNLVTVIEKWESMEAFNAHLNAPHVIQFRKEIKGIVKNISIKVLTEANEKYHNAGQQYGFGESLR